MISPQKQNTEITEKTKETGRRKARGSQLVSDSPILRFSRSIFSLCPLRPLWLVSLLFVALALLLQATATAQTESPRLNKFTFDSSGLELTRPAGPQFFD